MAFIYHYLSGVYPNQDYSQTFNKNMYLIIFKFQYMLSM